MTSFERLYLGLEPFFPPLWQRVRCELTRLGKERHGVLSILDVGGRKSHYTIGVPGRVTVTDLLRKTAVQQSLSLGVNGEIARQLRARRSNLQWVVFDDMTRSAFRAELFDCVVAVEVLEHVEEDEAFVREVQRVLKPGGVFLMTTPNGDFLRNTNPDHKRHYARRQLEDLLKRHFEQVGVEYAVLGGRFRRWGRKSWSMRRPLATVKSMLGNFLNARQSSREELKDQAQGTHHLVACARKGC
ncbi:MAG: methyltransferase domain-containing protein [Chloroflexi bacterium]|nr:methyltransferase domain-containing protein [Chloroflexota bacterium]